MSGPSPFFLRLAAGIPTTFTILVTGIVCTFYTALVSTSNVLINSCKITDVGKYLKMFAKNVTFKCINLALQYMSLVSLFLSLKYPLTIN